MGNFVVTLMFFVPGKKSYPSVNAGLFKPRVNPPIGPGPKVPYQVPKSFKQNCFRQGTFKAPCGSLHRDVKGLVYPAGKQLGK